MRIRAFITHKKAETYNDCQDRFGIGIDNNRIALSDGMTSGTLYPEIWAAQLVKNYVMSDCASISELLSEAREIWRKEVNQIYEEKKSQGKNPWRLENMINSNISAGATFCGISCDVNDKKWNGEVVGDSAIIELFQNEIRNIYVSGCLPPDNYPDYLDSIKSDIGISKIKCCSGHIEDHSTLLLVSDPFTDFLYRQEDNTNYVMELLSLNNHKEFVELVERWRETGMHNDDTTIVIVEFSKTGENIIDNIENLQMEKSKVEQETTIISLKTNGCDEHMSEIFTTSQKKTIIEMIKSCTVIPKKIKNKVIRWFEEKLKL